MLKAVFRPGELVPIQDKIVLGSPTSFPDLAHLAPVAEDAEDIETMEEYTGPTADDLRREAEAFKAQWDEDKASLIATTKAQAQDIINKAEEAGAREVSRKTDEAQALKLKAQAEAERIIAEARQKAQAIENEAIANAEIRRKEAENEGREEGHVAGFAEGRAEVDRLVERTQVMLERIQDKRTQILTEAEREIVDLVLLMTRKVVKIISENQREVIVANIIQALRKVKTRGNILIKVNFADLKLASEHVKDFIQLVEGAKNIQVLEDTSVDTGGCIIETDFGEIDARISSQLAELENRILEVSPITAKTKSESGAAKAQGAEVSLSQLLDSGSDGKTKAASDELPV